MTWKSHFQSHVSFVNFFLLTTVPLVFQPPQQNGLIFPIIDIMFNSCIYNLNYNSQLVLHVLSRNKL